MQDGPRRRLQPFAGVTSEVMAEVRPVAAGVTKAAGFRHRARGAPSFRRKPESILGLKGMVRMLSPKGRVSSIYMATHVKSILITGLIRIPF